MKYIAYFTNTLLTTGRYFIIFKVYPLNKEKYAMDINEYVPKGYVNMTEYNRAEKVKYWMQGIIGAIVLFGVYALGGFIDNML